MERTELHFGFVLACLVSAALLLGCQTNGGTQERGVEQQQGSLESVWPDVTCPQPANAFQARKRLNDIKGWATADGRASDVVPLADACLAHSDGGNAWLKEYHRARVYAAWAHAKQAHSKPRGSAIQNAYYDLCVEELTHASDGSGQREGQ